MLAARHCRWLAGLAGILGWDTWLEGLAHVPVAGGRVVVAPFDIPVGRVAVVADPFGNTLVLLDLSKGRYVTDSTGNVTGVTP
jgi:predicted enzyme related to lactoylglutathione lyase